MRRAAGLLVATALALAGCHSDEQAAPNNATAAAAPADSHWIDTVALTPEGGFRMGNPAAKARLVEYGSYTCPHCAAFAEEAMPGIRQLVATGQFSFELRNYAREEFDLTAALVARCGGTAGFFPISEQIYGAQMEWIGNAQNMQPSEQARIDALPAGEQFKALAHATGLNGFAGAHGIDAAKLDQCLTDPKAVGALVAIHDRADRDYHIQATPMFLLNDTLIRSADWKMLKPQIDVAIGA